MQQLARDPLRGQLVENLVLLELIKSRYNQGVSSNLYFYRDTSGKEIDIIFQKGSQLVPIEVKSSQTFNRDFLKNFEFFKKIAGEKYEAGFLIYAGDQEQKIGDINLLNYTHSSRATV